MTVQTTTLLRRLRSAGVVIPQPAAVYFSPEVNPACIAPGVVLWPGARLAGAELSIGPGCEIGTEGPASLTDCQLGSNVRIGSGFLERATLLDGVRVGSFAHVRPGCLIEEHCTLGESVGLKQTVLMPWVAVGSLVNFCDCLLAGGTGPGRHSEVGSGFVHFNFTPRQDKATPSLFGDVPNGVLLASSPVFLGGQSGVVGPAVLPFGAVLPAGCVWRGTAKRLVLRNGVPKLSHGLSPARAALVRRLNLAYIGNLRAFAVWYRKVRLRFLAADPFSNACLRGALVRISEMLAERGRRYDEWRQNAGLSGSSPDTIPDCVSLPPAVQRVVDSLPSTGYLSAIQGLPPVSRRVLARWLSSLAR